MVGWYRVVQWACCANVWHGWLASCGIVGALHTAWLAGIVYSTGLGIMEAFHPLSLRNSLLLSRSRSLARALSLSLSRVFSRAFSRSLCVCAPSLCLSFSFFLSLAPSLTLSMLYLLRSFSVLATRVHVHV